MMTVTVIYPEDTTELEDKYFEMLAEFAIKKFRPEEIQALINYLKNEELKKAN